MITEHCQQYRAEILDHFCNGRPGLRAAAKAHLGTCVACTAAVTELLTQGPAGNLHQRGDVQLDPITEEDLGRVPFEARKAFEHGRCVLQRELGAGKQ